MQMVNQPTKPRATHYFLKVIWFASAWVIW